jgi:uncharacterized oligopeptide transporter (OPT) family protein
MPLLQRPPARDDADARSPGPPVETVLAYDEAEWVAKVFRGDAPQLTARAIAMGSLLGFVLSLTNIYVGLKTGWFLHVAITASVLSVASWSILVRAGIARSPMSILESNCVQSVASSAGYATGNTLVSAVPALLLVTGQTIAWRTLVPWVLLLAVLGVLMAVPLKRQMIDRERLRFPTGTAAAVVLQALYGDGKEALVKARALLVAATIAAAGPLLFDLQLRAIASGGARHALIVAPMRVFDRWVRMPAPRFDAARGVVEAQWVPASAWNVRLDHSVLFVAAGALVGVRVAASMLAGALVLALVIGPAALGATWTDPHGALVTAATSPGTAFATIGVWYGASLVVGHGVALFLLQWRTIGRAVAGVRAAIGRGAREAGGVGRARDADVPARWVARGFVIAALGVIALAWFAFGIAPHLGALAVAMTFFLALVACRATGETDVTPIGAMGKITQLAYGALAPQNVQAGLMTAAITAGASNASADLLSDLKSGYLLGAHPRRQVLAQLSGIVSGTIASCLAYALLVPDASVLRPGPGGEPPVFAAPSAHQWEAVARVLATGLDHLHPMARHGIVAGGACGLLLALVDAWAPAARRYVPSAAGLGLGMMFPFYQALAMFLGALAAWAFHRAARARAERFAVPIASGLIVGESVLGIAVQAVNQLIFR